MAETVISLRLGEAYWLNIQLVPEYDRSFEYDLVGNAVGGSRGLAEFYSNFLARNGSSTFVADPDGFGETIKEITGDKVKNYVYRADGKISPFRSGNLSVNYFYDGLDRLVVKAVNQIGNQYTQIFTHLTDENRVLLGKAEDGSITTYIDGNGVLEHLGEVKEGTGKGYIIDHLGSVLNSDVAGSSKAYGLFGEVTTNVPVYATTSPVHYAWQGLRYDPATGQYDNIARTYDQNTGTFRSQDPLGLDGGLNLYGSRKNNPLIYADPDGRTALHHMVCMAKFEPFFKTSLSASVSGDENIESLNAKIASLKTQASQQNSCPRDPGELVKISDQLSGLMAKKRKVEDAIDKLTSEAAGKIFRRQLYKTELNSFY